MDIEKICRTCMNLSGPLMSLFNSDNAKNDCLGDMLFQTTELRVKFGDGLPMKACLACISEINRSYAFRLKCHNSNNMLRQLLPDAPAEKPTKSDVAIQTSCDEVCKLNSASQTETFVQKHQQSQTAATTAGSPNLRKPSTRIRNVHMKKIVKIKEFAQSIETNIQPNELPPKCLAEGIREEIGIQELVFDSTTTPMHAKEPLSLEESAEREFIEVIENECVDFSEEDEDNGRNILPIEKKTVSTNVCENCEAIFFSATGFASHKRQCFMKESASCNQCDRTFETEALLKEHKVEHKISCTHCQKSFTTKDEQEQHTCKTKRKSSLYKCDVCEKRFTMLSTLRDHGRIHTGEKPFECEICKKKFTQKANLRQHLLRHNETKQFNCKHCKSAYVTRAELLSHERTHTGDRPFECTFCDAKFTSSCSLVKHRRRHTGERPYACEFCPSRFTTLNVLKNHRRIHTGEKPYACKFCAKRFKQKGDCYVHERKQHKDKDKGLDQKDNIIVHYTICNDEDGSLVTKVENK